MICRRAFRTLNQLLKLAAKHVVHLQLACDLFGNIQAARASRVEIDLLQDQNIGIRTDKEAEDALQLLAPVNVPIYNAQRTRWPKLPPGRREIAGNDFLHGQTYSVAEEQAEGKRLNVGLAIAGQTPRLLRMAPRPMPSLPMSLLDGSPHSMDWPG